MDDERLETGLSGLVYEPPNPLNEIVPITAAVNLPVGLDLDKNGLVRLAQEIAMNLKSRAEVLTAFNITTEQYEQIAQVPFYKRALDSAILEWGSAGNTEKRIKIGAAVYVEAGLPVLAARMLDKHESLPAVVEVGKYLKSLSGVGEADRTNAPGEKFTININLGADEKIQIEKDITPKAPSVPAPSQIPENTKGP